MNFDFDHTPARRGSNSYKWDTVGTDVLPLWVADMDFPTAPCVRKALERRVAHGVFGYTRVPEEYFTSTASWFEHRHLWLPRPEHMLYTSGVVPAISAIIKAMTRPGDGVVVLTPVFNCFFSSIRNNGCRALEVPLVIGRDGKYEIDWQLLNDTCARPDAKILLLCNPHNPGGRVWSAAELRLIASIAEQHRLFVISDEIHCELTYPGYDYTPYASLGSDVAANAAVCISPSKAFNIAGLQIATIVSPDDEVRRRIDRAININEVCDVNPFGFEATIAAYREGAPWLDALRAYLNENCKLVADFFANHFPRARVMPLESTYLAWIDFRYTGLSGDEIYDLLVREARVALSPGSIFGAPGDGFMRLNFACPRAILSEALNRIGQIGRGLT